MTLAVGDALLEHIGSGESLSELTVQKMQGYGRKYRKAGYGGLFRRWLNAKAPQPYGSFGNGSAMRVSAVAHVASSPEEVQKLSHEVTAVTHDHEEGLKGAEATAMAIYLARTGAALEEINVFAQIGPSAGHTSMDQEKIEETKEKVENWLADKQHRRCCKVAMCAANAVVLLGLTMGLTLLWVNELRRANGHNHCCRNNGQQ